MIFPLFCNETLERKGQDKNISQSRTLGLGQITLTAGLSAPAEDDNQGFNAL